MRKLHLLIQVAVLLIVSVPLSAEKKSPSHNVIIYEKSGPPLVFVKILFKGGTAFDLKGGECNLLARILTQSELSKILEQNGTSVNIETQYDYFSIEYEILSEYHYDTLTRVLQFLNAFKIDPKIFAHAKNQVMQKLKIQEDDFYDKVRNGFIKELYGQHRYGKPLTGDFASVEKISLEDAFSVYNRLKNKDDMTLIMTGNFEKAEKKSAAYGKLLKQFTSAASKKIESSVPALLKEDRDVVIHAPSSQVFVRTGCLGIARNHPDSLYYMVLSEIIGGGFGSILTKKLREEEGLTYSPVANFYSQRRERGYFFVAYSTRVENLEKSLAFVRDIFKELLKDGIKSENFELARNYIYGTFLQREETNEGISELLTEQVVFGLKNSFWKTQKDELAKLNFKKLNGIIKDFFSHSRFITIILKPAGS